MANLWLLKSIIVANIGSIVAVIALPLALPNCPDSCGNVSIPYPFGTEQGCYLNEEFFIFCNTTQDPPRAFLNSSNVEVTEIMLSEGQLRALPLIVRHCYDDKGSFLANQSSSTYLSLSKFSVSPDDNAFTVVGCDAYGLLGFHGQNQTGCYSQCENLGDVANGSCTGYGCCKASIPPSLFSTPIFIGSLHNRTSVSNFNPCDYAFVVERSYYIFNSLDFYDLKKVGGPPVILDWTVGNGTCPSDEIDQTGYACKSRNSHCRISYSNSGYTCRCVYGFVGNPYLENGCQDNCSQLQGDGKNDGEGCSSVNSRPNFFQEAIDIIEWFFVEFWYVVLSFLLLVCACVLGCCQKKKLTRMRKKHFQQNGGLILQQILSEHDSLAQTFTIHTANDLKRATDNYHESKVLGQGGQGTVYRGELPDGGIVAIKKSNFVDKSQVKQFINEVVILSTINHRNVVRLLGCCLETEVPMLVYEFITNGTLFEHIQRLNGKPPLLWHTRLRVAAETARAVSYMHSFASIPIFHRDIKSKNILLDKSCTTKVSDFGISRFVSADKTHLTTLVQGTFGYLDPEYFYSSQLTEKSDVYSFGVVLVEILTGQQAVCFERPEEDQSLTMYFLSSIKRDMLFEIFEENLKLQVNASMLNEVAMVAARCLNVKGVDRPTMKEVAMELEGLCRLNSEENEI